MQVVSKPQLAFRYRLLRAVAIYAGIPYVVVTLGFVACQRMLLYPSTRTERIATPRVVGAELTEIEVPTHDGLMLRGWLLQGLEVELDPTTIPGAVRPLVLCFAGNSEDRRSRLSELQEFQQLGCDVMLCDYRGYGDNPGSPTESDLHHDADSIWVYACDQLGRSPREIVLFGESLGGAVAIQLAARQCAAGDSPAGLVVSSTFDSVPAVVARKYPLFPFRWLVLDTYRSDLAIPNVTCPITILHGTDDEITPLEHARRLFNCAPKQAANGRLNQFVELSGRGHNDVPRTVLAEAVRSQLPMNEGRQP